VLVGLLDRFSIGLSALCLLHCLDIPLLISMTPVVATFAFADESFHIALVALVVPTSAVALGLGCRKHQGWDVVTIGLIGLALLGTAAFSEGLGLGEIGETVLTVIGALVVASAHVLNYRACRACDCEHH
jgi:hypothetical protein